MMVYENDDLMVLPWTIVAKILSMASSLGMVLLRTKKCLLSISVIPPAARVNHGRQVAVVVSFRQLDMLVVAYKRLKRYQISSVMKRILMKHHIS